MRLHRSKTRERRGVTTLDAVICTAVLVPLAATAYALVRVSLGVYLNFIEAATGSSLL